MKTIFSIYKKDIRSIFTNWVALVVIVALMFLPSLYAWFNIKASWDPYSNTSGILVAVVNEDQGAFFDGKEVNIGNKLTNQLKENNNIGWTFVDKEEAQEGVKNAKYYASVTIPEDFSRNIASITESEHKKAEIIYTVNEKMNAVAPKITKSGVTTIQQQVTSNIVETVDYVIFDIFNKISVEINEKLPQIKSLIQIIYEVDQKIPEINKAVNEAYEGANTLQNVINHMQNNMPLIEDTVIKASEAVETSGTFLKRIKDGLSNVNPNIQENLTALGTTTQTVHSYINNAIPLVESDPIAARTLLNNAKESINDGQSTVSHLMDYLQSLNRMSNSNNLNATINSLQTHKSTLDQLAKTTDMPLSLELLESLKNDSEAALQFIDKLINNYDTQIAPSVDKTVNEILAVVEQTDLLLQEANNDIPKLKALLNTATSTVNIGIQDIDKLKQDLPLIEGAIQSIAQKLKTLDEDEQLNEMLRLLKLDAKKEAEFLASPVDINQISLYEIPNYGSAMSPFFTTLSLWVGALILVSLLSVNATPYSQETLKREVRLAFLGRYLTFITIAVFQALIVTLGDVFLLKTYVANKVAFILLAVFISIVFCTIVYTLVSVFGNAGKALAMILLVLQISASGGTFPIEVMPNFFQAIHPLLPFTYAVGGMRETTGGIIWTILWSNIAILLLYFIAFLLIGIVWKAPLRARVTKFTEKLKKSGLVEH